MNTYATVEALNASNNDALVNKIHQNKKQFTSFFPTPPQLVNHIINAASIEPEMRVLEPSAGMGDIAAAAREYTKHVDVVEIEPQLVEYLKTRGFNPLQSDFLKVDRPEQYDRVLMNPPFAKGLDIMHTMHAYTMLKPGGRLVAIVYGQAGEFRNQNHKRFREFLKGTNATVLPCPSESFKNGFNPTKVDTKFIVVDKPICQGSLINNADQATLEQAQKQALELYQTIQSVESPVLRECLRELEASTNKKMRYLRYLASIHKNL